MKPPNAYIQMLGFSAWQKLSTWLYPIFNSAENLQNFVNLDEKFLKQPVFRIFVSSSQIVKLPYYYAAMPGVIQHLV